MLRLRSTRDPIFNFTHDEERPIFLSDEAKLPPPVLAEALPSDRYLVKAGRLAILISTPYLVEEGSLVTFHYDGQRIGLWDPSSRLVDILEPRCDVGPVLEALRKLDEHKLVLYSASVNPTVNAAVANEFASVLSVWVHLSNSAFDGGHKTEHSRSFSCLVRHFEADPNQMLESEKREWTRRRQGAEYLGLPAGHHSSSCFVKDCCFDPRFNSGTGRKFNLGQVIQSLCGSVESDQGNPNVGIATTVNGAVVNCAVETCNVTGSAHGDEHRRAQVIVGGEALEVLLEPCLWRRGNVVDVKRYLSDPASLTLELESTRDRVELRPFPGSNREPRLLATGTLARQVSAPIPCTGLLVGQLVTVSWPFIKGCPVLVANRATNGCSAHMKLCNGEVVEAARISEERGAPCQIRLETGETEAFVLPDPRVLQLVHHSPGAGGSTGPRPPCFLRDAFVICRVSSGYRVRYVGGGCCEDVGPDRVVGIRPSRRLPLQTLGDDVLIALLEWLHPAQLDVVSPPLALSSLFHL